MTLKELIAWGDLMKPNNRFTTDEKTRWINTVEALQQAPEIQYNYETDQEKELILKPPHDEVYRWYLMAQLSAANEEYDRYQNEMEMFNGAWDTFMLWVCTEIDPVNGNGGSGGGNGGGGGLTSGAVLYTEQMLNVEQQAQARENIGAVSVLEFNAALGEVGAALAGMDEVIG